MNINPELVKAAANMARPGMPWKVVNFSDSSVVIIHEQKPGIHLAGQFCPIRYENDAFALERALKKDGWEFSYERDEFQASREHSKPIMVGGMPGQEISTELLSDESDTMLLLLVVSAMTNIPMSTGGGE